VLQSTRKALMKIFDVRLRKPLKHGSFYGVVRPLIEMGGVALLSRACDGLRRIAVQFRRMRTDRPELRPAKVAGMT